MRQVHLLETFNDVRAAFSEACDGDSSPRVEAKARLHISRDRLVLESKSFVLSDDLANSGSKFVVDCINFAIGNRFSADHLRT